MASRTVSSNISLVGCVFCLCGERARGRSLRKGARSFSSCFLGLGLVLACSFWCSGEARCRSAKTIWIGAPGAYLQSEEYKHLLQYLRLRGFDAGHSSRHRAASSLRLRILGRGRFSCTARRAKRLYRLPSHLQEPAVRARTIVLYLTIFLDSLQAPSKGKAQRHRRGPPSSRRHPSSQKANHHQGRAKKGERAAGGARKKASSSRRAPPRREPPTSRSVARGQATSRASSPATRPLSRPSESSRPATAPTPRRRDPFVRASPWWFEVGGAGALRWGILEELSLGGHLLLTAGWKYFFLQLEAGAHFYLLALEETILLLRPSLLVGLIPPLGLRLGPYPLDFLLMAGLTAGFRLLQGEGTPLALTLGGEAALQIYLRLHPHVGIFVGGNARFFPFKFLQAQERPPLRGLLLQITIFSGVRYRF